MTTEEKARAYDEALKLAKEKKEIASRNGADITVKFLEEIFPELRESEDERIIEEIKFAVMQMPTERQDTKERCITWLEKQKEQKPAEGKEYSSPDCGTTAGYTNDESEYDKGYKEGHRFGLQQTQEYMLPGGRTFIGLIPCWVNAPSELQPAHKYHGKNVVIMHENNGGFRCVCIDDEKPVTFHLPEDTFFAEGWRKKPAEYADDVVEEAEEYTSKVACGEYGVEVTEAYIAGVLSERNRYTEWSEEDEEFFRLLHAGLYAMKVQIGKDAYDKAVERLKSLRPSWKPSEEQPKGDLDADIKMEWDSFNKHIAKYSEGAEVVVWLNWFSFVDIANYFYKFGLNARNEEKK